MATYCSNCGNATVPTAKFCAECGTKLDELMFEEQPRSQATVLDAASPEAGDSDIPSVGFTIQFNSSGSANYPFAVRAAKASAAYQESTAGKVMTHQATFQRHEVAWLLELLDALKGFRNRKVWVDGQSMLWDEAFGWLWCFNQRKSSYVPELYCFGEEQYTFNLWGCIHSGMGFAPGARWLAHGRFDRDGAFHLDKDRIRHEAKTALHRYRFCPAFNASMIDEITDALPEKIDPRRDKDWEYQESYGLLDSGNNVLTVRIKEGGYSYDRQVNGVQPKSLDAARAILKRISKKLPGG